jgi:hypothetical protein
MRNPFGDQHLVAMYRSQLKTRTQSIGESLQEFYTTVKHLAHRAYPVLPEDHVRREGGKAFTNGVEATDTKIQLLPSSQAPKNDHQVILGEPIPPPPPATG